jgi:hypothetical protein
MVRAYSTTDEWRHLVRLLPRQSVRAIVDVNLGQLGRDGVVLYAREAAAIVYALCDDLRGRNAKAAPRLEELWITPEGELRIESGVRRPDLTGTPPGEKQSEDRSELDLIRGLAALLETLLPPLGTTGADYAVRASLRMLAPRGRQMLPGLPPVDGVEDLAMELRRYVPDEPRAVLRQFWTRVGGYLSERTPRRVESVHTHTLSAVSAAEPTPQVVAVPVDAAAQQPHAPSDAGPYDDREHDVVTEPAGEVVLVRDVLISTRKREDHRPPALSTIAAVRDPSGPPQHRMIAVALLVLLMIIGFTFGWRWGSRRPAPSNARVVATSPDRSGSASSSSDQSVLRRPVPLRTPAALGAAYSPSFGNDGREVVFHVGRDPVARLARAQLGPDATVRAVSTILDEPARSYHPRISPDGHWVAFDSDREGERAVYVAHRDLSNLTRVSGDGMASLPSWSPDMKWLAFVRAETRHPRVWNLWIRDVRTGQLTRLTSYRFGQTWSASWFPDARRICYSHEDRLIVLDLLTRSSRTFRSPRPKHLVRTPAVSPDGRRVIFQVHHDGGWLLDVDTGRMRRVLDDETAEEFAWDPGGRRIAYHSRRGGRWQLWLMPATG